MKVRTVAFVVLLILFADQALKIWVKTSFICGSHVNVLGDKFQLLFTENRGMAYGWSFGGEWGKLFLSIFRILAVIFGTWYIGRIIAEKYHKGFIICAALIYAGAIGNLIDSMFYGMIFDKGMMYDASIDQLMSYEGLAKFSSKGYSSFLHGNVVDMLHFPVIEGTFPDWVPFVGKDKSFIFFRPIFNIADAAISTGVISILVFQRKFFKKAAEKPNPTVETQAIVNDEAQVL
jgi:signal peptidase II